MGHLTGRPEPLLDAAALVAMATAIIGLLIAFGVPLTEDQKMTIIGAVAVFAPFVVGWLARQDVTPLEDPRDYDGQALVRGDE
jgi:hydrogenase/urease accessory protein HupE